ncbi:MAG: hypothetical protein E7666_01325 [Ruminococcaceae bacterium]|nr:hypothetical protein [Oscillospiraceae bacterium]
MFFYQAKAVYPQGKECEQNTFATFRAQTGSLRGTTLSITAASFYQLYVNGKFVAFGPARTAKGYARVDVLPLELYDNGDQNEITVAVVGYHVCSLSTVRQPSFLIAELRRGNEVLCATGRDFTAYLPGCKLQKTVRYSVQRHFTEIWDFRDGTDLTPDSARVPLSVLQNPPKPIERRAPYPYYEDILLSQSVSGGTLTFDEERPYRKGAYSFQPFEDWGTFGDDETVSHPFVWIQRRRQTQTREAEALPLTLSENDYVILDFSRIETGFPMLSVLAESTADLVVAFSEYCSPTEFSFTRMNVQNALEYLLPAGQTVNAMSFEPYVMRYVIIAVRSGSVRLNSFGIKTFMHTVADARRVSLEDPTLAAVYRGAVRTFAHNAVDLYTDCPSRERAGWLCDSYFTAKTEHALFGNTMVEDAFLENYRLYRNEGEYPDGMIPMCFPADPHLDDGGHVIKYHSKYKFIPQWSMWYVLEVEDYLTHRNPTASVEQFRPSIEGLLDFYSRYENEDGLLEALPSWNFVEWSRANEWTQDVSYPTNFLYAQVLECAYRLFGNADDLRRANEVRAKAVEQSFNGTVFLDHAVRDEHHHLIRLNDCSEACQYYAILFGGIDIQSEKYAKLHRLVTEIFGATRREPMPEIAEINAFIGAYLRLEALLKMKEYKLVLRDVKEFFGEMEQKTGTLWEYREGKGSRDHGFASYALVAILKALRLD